MPRRLIDIIEGESLVNDGTALVLLRTALVAAVTGVVLAVGGGLAARAQHRRRDRRRPRGRLRHPPRPAHARQPAARGDDRVPHRLLRVPARRRRSDVSGVLAVVTAGVYMGWYTPELTTVQTRLQGRGFWEILDVPAERAAVRAGRAAAAADPRRALRHGRLVARRRRGGDRARGDRPPDRLGLPGDLRAALADPAPARARPVTAVAVPGVRLVERHARRRDDRGRAARSRSTPTPARRFPAAT